MQTRAVSALLAFLLIAPVVVLHDTSPAEAARGNEKYAICHRTNAVKNPYRRISVAWGALAAHQNHTGLPFDVTNPDHLNKIAKWGDIFYASRGPGGGNTRHINWTTAGQSIFSGSTYQLNGETRTACRAMSTIEFLHAEAEAGTPMREIMQDLDEQAATEDLALRTALGRTFTSWYDDPTTPKTLEGLTAGLEAKSPTATTQSASTVSTTTATLNGTVNPQGAPAALLFEYSTNANLTSPVVVNNPTPATSAATSPISVTAPLTGLAPSTTYYFRLVASISAGSGDDAIDQDVLGQILSFRTADLNAPTVATETLPSGQEGEPYEVTLDAMDGVPPYSGWQATSLPDWLTLDATTGVLSGTPTAADAYQFGTSVAGANAARSAVKSLDLVVTSADEPPAKQARTLTLEVDHPQRTVGQTASVSATPSSGSGTITYSVTDDASACELEGTSLTASAAATCLVSASIAETDDHLAASADQVSVTFVAPVTPDPPTNVITFLPLDDRFVDAGPGELAATASSGLTVSFASATPGTCTVAGTAVVPISAGVCTVIASQPGAGSGEGAIPAAVPVQRSFSITKRPNTISFAQPADRPVTAPPFLVTPSASSGLAVALSSATPTVCVVGGNKVSLLTVGTCRLEATQAGDRAYEAAAPVSRSFVVNHPTVDKPGPGPGTPVTPPPPPPGPGTSPSTTPPQTTTPPVSPPFTPPTPAVQPPATQPPAVQIPRTSNQPTVPDAPVTTRPRPQQTTPAQPAVGDTSPSRPGIVRDRPGEVGDTGDQHAAPGHDLGVSDDATAPIGDGSPENSIDVGSGVTTTASGADDLSRAHRTPRGLMRESLGGFRAGTTAWVEVLGARTAGQFILSSSDTIDAHAVAAALRESSTRTATEFAWVDGAEVATSGDAALIKTGPAAVAERERVFASAQLTAPGILPDLDVPADSQWLRVTASVATYQPGSTVYLAVTSDPLLVAEARVDRHGEATITGAFPLDVVGVGGHRIRIVGTRTLGGVTVDADGQVQLSSETLAEIRRFDAGTHATVNVVGENSTSGRHVAVRIVPLTDTAPWWTLWIVGGVALVTIVLRRTRKLDRAGRAIAARLAVLASAGPALVLGWVAVAYGVMGWGAALAGAGLAASSLVPRRRDDDADLDTMESPEPSLVG